ncbi:SMP-30/gluconolactonase/LRE family protein [Agrococcus sp. KRD186]|uniref:SMP-30/gluconolactonase/LRE family protein n=1 Tax=Agrococcus sp. KRD186 TaxID=2729730 RepID=UPI0019D0AFB7|nr:SMP-30/gluconolactonase/LRE family protein [Agrococcus sp. KRD186]
MGAARYTAEPVVGSGDGLGESVVWDAERSELSWVDIHAARLQRWGSETGLITATLPERIGAIGLRAGGGHVAAFASGFALLGEDGEIERRIAEVEPELPTTRLNDGRVDRQGRFVCGGMDEAADQRAVSAVYRLDADGAVVRILDGIACANSIAFSPDGTRMYFTDMPTGRIVAYAYDIDEGVPHDPVLISDGTEYPGLPDGSTVDADGCLWNARWGSGAVVRFTPDGALDAIVEVAVGNPTCPAFGGPDLSTLFITTARFGRTDTQLAGEPRAGDVFTVDVAASGIAEPRFLG